MLGRHGLLKQLSDKLGDGEEFPIPSFPGNQRVLDPEVVAAQSLNATLPAGARAAFLKVWTEVANRRKNLWPISPKGWTDYWAALTASQARLAPSTARAGCAEDRCIGT